MNVNSIFPPHWRLLPTLWLKTSVNMGLVAMLLIPGLIGFKAAIEAKLYPVTGKVIVDDVLPAGTVVRFHPVKPHHWVCFPPAATVADDGSFRIKTLGFRDGAPAGTYSVTAVWCPTIVTDNGPGPGANMLPTEYASPHTTPLQAIVPADEDQILRFALSCRCTEMPQLKTGH
jgi:hypothetical protein